MFALSGCRKPADWIKYWVMISFWSFFFSVQILTHSWGKIWHYNLATNPVVCFQRDPTRLPTCALPYSLASLANIPNLCLGWGMPGLLLRPHLACILMAIYLGRFHHSSKNMYFSVLWICSALIPLASIKQVDTIACLNTRIVNKLRVCGGNGERKEQLNLKGFIVSVDGPSKHVRKEKNLLCLEQELSVCLTEWADQCLSRPELIAEIVCLPGDITKFTTPFF